MSVQTNTNIGDSCVPSSAFPKTWKLSRTINASLALYPSNPLVIATMMKIFDGHRTVNVTNIKTRGLPRICATPLVIPTVIADLENLQSLSWPLGKGTQVLDDSKN